MAELATIATIVSTAATAGGTIIGMQGQMAAGDAAARQAKYQARQLDIKAKEEQAAAQREMLAKRRDTDEALSALQSRAAGSGFSATDVTSLALADEIARYGSYQEQMLAYGGESRRKGYEAQAQGARLTGGAQKTAAGYDAASTLIGGVTSIADRFRKPAPTGSPYRYAPTKGGGGFG